MVYFQYKGQEAACKFRGLHFFKGKKTLVEDAAIIAKLRALPGAFVEVKDEPKPAAAAPAPARPSIAAKA